MKFFFCESCGKRVTELDIEGGLGRDKKLKGVYCKQCAVGVMTMENLPLSEEQAQQLLAQPGISPPNPAGGKGLGQESAAPAQKRDASGTAPARSRGLGGRAAGPADERSSNPVRGLLWGGGAVVLVGVLALLLLRPRPAATPESKVQATSPKSLPAPDLSRIRTAEPSPAASSVPQVSAPESTPLPPPPPQPSELSAEQRAQAAFEFLMKELNVLPPDDKEKHIDAIETYLQEHDDAIVASRARTLLAQLQRPAVATPVTASGAATPPAPGAAVSAGTDPLVRATGVAGEYTCTFQDGLRMPDATASAYLGTRVACLSSYTGYKDQTRRDFKSSAKLRTLLAFNLTRQEGGCLPDDVEILEARLSFYKYQGGARTIEIDRVTSPWRADQATWNSPAQGVPWKTPAGDVSNRPASIPCPVNSKGDAVGWCEFDVTQMLREMVKEGKNYGWRVMTFSPDHRQDMNSGATFCANTTKDPKARPKLVLKVRGADWPGLKP